MKIKSIEKLCYQPLADWMLVMVDIINALPNAEEIKQREDYKKAYQKYTESVGKYFAQKKGDTK